MAALTSPSVSSAFSLIGLQLFSRLLTFGLNQGLLRLASPKAFGTAAIQFELLLSSILFLSREGIRGALLRSWPNKDQPASVALAARNLSIVPFFVGLPLALAASTIYTRSAGIDTYEQPNFMAAIAIYALAAVVELLSEPMHIRTMGDLRTTVRVRAEGLAVTAKPVTTFLVLWLDAHSGQFALIAFALGQLAYSVTLWLVYTREYGLMTPKLASIPGTSKYFDQGSVRISRTLTSQSLLKHFLTEGDKFILSWLSPLQDQGGYAVAVNYGSLVARILFQPIEEISRSFFSKTLATTTTTTTPGVSPTRESLKQASNALTTLISVQTSFSLLLFTFGTAYAPIFIRLLLPRSYLHTTAPDVLSAWIWYIPVLAINGGLEAFVASVATAEDLNRQSRWMIGFSTLYISASLALYGLKIGDTSLVYANIINLSARILFSAHYATIYFARHAARDALRWKDVRPSKELVGALGVSGVVIWWNGTRVGLRGGEPFMSRVVLEHIALGAGLGVMCLAVWWASTGRRLALPGRGVKRD